MKCRKILGMLLAVAVIGSAAALAACGGGGGNGGGGSQTYTFEAEYIDLDNVSGAGTSIDKSGVDMIYGDGTQAQKDLGWSNGYYVGYTYSVNQPLNFVFESDGAATATIILRLGSELGDLNLTPDIYSVKLNGKEIPYTSIYVQGTSGMGAMAEMKFSDKTVTNSATLKEGKNVISLTVLSNTLNPGSDGAGRTGGPVVDCIKVQTSANLTWSPKTDNIERRDNPIG
jgi:lipoprotein